MSQLSNEPMSQSKCAKQAKYAKCAKPFAHLSFAHLSFVICHLSFVIRPSSIWLIGSLAHWLIERSVWLIGALSHWLILKVNVFALVGVPEDLFQFGSFGDARVGGNRSVVFGVIEHLGYRARKIFARDAE